MANEISDPQLFNRALTKEEVAVMYEKGPSLSSYLDSIRKRAEAATKGPWVWDNGNFSVETAYGSPQYRQEICSASNCVTLTGEEEREKHPYEMKEDMEFIAHSREDIPRLLAVIEKMREQMDLYRHDARLPCDLVLAEKTDDEECRKILEGGND